MNVEVNYLAVALATLSSMVVGSVWYAPPVFGNFWMKLAKVSRRQAEKAGWTPIVIAILTSVVTAYVLAHVAFLSHHFFNNSFLQDAVTTAFWLWLGLTAARLVTHDVFESRPWKLTALNCIHELVTLVVMGAVIGFVGI